MTHASLFSGIGGFDLASEWAGWTNMFNCEIDSFCRRVLKYHFPNAVQYEDIKTTDFTVWRGRIDVLTGGFPCQPFSLAGRRRGTEDDRYLWPEMLRAIREIRPRWVVGENVFGIVNWSQGLVFEQVCADLEAQGYEVQPYVLPACGVNAPHQRYRTWFVAYAHGYGRTAETQRQRSKDSQDKKQFECLYDTTTAAHCADARAESKSKRQELSDRREAASDTESTGFPTVGISNGIDSEERSDPKRRALQSSGFVRRTLPATCWQNFPTQSPVCGGDDGLPDQLDGITFSSWRIQSIKAYGNAIVPQVFYQIAKTINEYEKL